MSAVTADTAESGRVDARKAGRWLFVATVILLCAWVLFPIYLLIVNALSAPAEVTAFPKRFFPSFDFGSLSFFVNFAGVANALWNSVLVAGLTMVLSIGLGAPAGYALSRFDFPGKEAFRFLVLMTRAFPLPLLALPLAVMFIRTGLDDTAIGLALVHTTLALPFAVLITFSLFSGIPFELEEAAWTLGCTRLQAFTKVILPLALPGIAASAVFAFTISESPLYLKFAGGAALVIPALIFIFAVRKYLFAMWGIANR
jgi:multiple sugar transport system permease protein